MHSLTYTPTRAVVTRRLGTHGAVTASLAVDTSSSMIGIDFDWPLTPAGEPSLQPVTLADGGLAVQFAIPIINDAEFEVWYTVLPARQRGELTDFPPVPSRRRRGRNSQ